MISLRSSSKGLWSEIARWNCSGSSAKRLILSTSPLVEAAMCRAARANPSGSLNTLSAERSARSSGTAPPIPITTTFETLSGSMSRATTKTCSAISRASGCA